MVEVAMSDGMQHLAQWVAIAAAAAAIFHSSWTRREQGHEHNLALEKRVAGLEERIKPLEIVVASITTKLDNILFKMGQIDGRLFGRDKE